DEAATMQDTATVVPFAVRLRSALDGRAARLTRAAALGIALLSAPSLAVHAQVPVAAEPAGPAAVTPAEGAAAALAGTPRLDVRLGDGSDDDVRVTGTVGAVI